MKLNKLIVIATMAIAAPLLVSAGEGEDTYNAACTACHGPGIAGAPKMGDAAAWKGRLSKGEETLVKHAIEGFQGDTGMMPPKGGRMDISDEAITAAVQYMIAQASE